MHHKSQLITHRQLQDITHIHTHTHTYILCLHVCAHMHTHKHLGKNNTPLEVTSSEASFGDHEGRAITEIKRVRIAALCSRETEGKTHMLSYHQ